MLQTVLIANRGEIAVRILRTLRATGRRGVAIYTDLDATAPHVLAADDAVRIESYLDIEEVIAAARTSGADAIHPGYGFLSERSEFARAVEAAGLKLIGPSADVMDQMGRKDRAREIAMAAGVPVVPAYELDTPPADLAFPVLVKAAAGGGGKGMRIVRSEGEYADARAAAAREAASAFGDDTLLIEKYVERGRHIEVQVLGDTHGKVIHLGTRDCSTQRRHQKVIEEAPAPNLDPHLRHRMHQAAVDLAKNVGYESAGTVEFLLDADTGEFYFLEMNTRLQVEHPVTEMVCGNLDLVEQQLWIADGGELGLEDYAGGPTGHSIEARIYAEDSFNGFLPQAGATSIVRWPAGVRVDHALEPGQVVSTSYDPMLGKVIVHGPTREAARLALVKALDDTAILGLTTNTGFLRALAASDEFRDATIDTAWLDHHDVPAPDDELARICVAWVSTMLIAGEAVDHPFRGDGWRSAGPSTPTTIFLDRPIAVDRVAGTVDGRRVHQHDAANHVLTLSIDGQRHRATVNVQADVLEAVHHGQRFTFTRHDPIAEHGPKAADGTLLAPMPGTVLDVRVAAGEHVSEGQILGVMEAMKMELSLKAPYDGVVTEVDAVAGKQVALGAALFVVEEHADD